MLILLLILLLGTRLDSSPEPTGQVLCTPDGQAYRVQQYERNSPWHTVKRERADDKECA